MMYFDEAGVEQFRTNFYNVERWDAGTGWSKRKTVEELSLKKVADTPAANKS
jgi:hypothetical protein